MVDTTDEIELSSRIRVGIAGWNIPSLHKGLFPPSGTHLERYAARFPAVEINSTFYRPHRPATYERWAESVPADFKFAVKVPRQITHYSRLKDLEAFERFLSEAGALGDKLGCLLVQLPPSLAFNLELAAQFFGFLRERYAGQAACEPRHTSWFTPQVERMLADTEIARVAADPALSQPAAQPGGWDRLVYYRLHGSPKMYYSEYSLEYLDALVLRLLAAAETAEVWCIFDNTAEGAAVVNGLYLLERISEK